MSDSDIEKRLSDAIEQWQAAGQTIRDCVYSLGLMNRPSLWLTDRDKEFLRKIDSVFTREENNEHHH